MRKIISQSPEKISPSFVFSHPFSYFCASEKVREEFQMTPECLTIYCEKRSYRSINSQRSVVMRFRKRRGVAEEREARRGRHGNPAAVRSETAPVHRTAQHQVVPGQREDLRLQRRGRDDARQRRSRIEVRSKFVLVVAFVDESLPSVRTGKLVRMDHD